MQFHKSKTLFHASVLTLALAAGPAFAADWRLVEVSGVVRVAAPGAAPTQGKLDQIVPTGSSVTTAAGARAKLDNGGKHIVVGPNSRMTVAPDTSSGMMRIVQDLGAVMFQVDKKQAPHFRVDTPLLAAIVKGTTFTVVVTPQSDAVNVAEGLVEVRSNASNMSGSVPGGSTGAVFRDAPGMVKVAPPLAAAGPVALVQPPAPLDYKRLSDGLVESAAGAPAAAANGLAARDSTPAASNSGLQTGGATVSVAMAEAVHSQAAVMDPGASALARDDGAAGAHGGGDGGGSNGNAGGGNGNGGDHGAGGNGNAGNGNAGGGGGGNGNGDGNAGGGNGNAGNGDAGGGEHGGGNGNGNGNGDSGAGNGNAGNGNSGGGNAGAGAGNGNGNAGNGNAGGGGGNAGAGNGNGNGNGNVGNGNAGGGAEHGGGSGAGGGNAGNGNGGGGNSGNGNGGGNSGNGGGNSGNGGGNSGNGGGGNGSGGNGGGNGAGGLVGALINDVTHGRGGRAR